MVLALVALLAYEELEQELASTILVIQLMVMEMLALIWTEKKMLLTMLKVRAMLDMISE